MSGVCHLYHKQLADIQRPFAPLSCCARGPAGPHVPWRPGRIDKSDGNACPPDGRLPDAAQGASHVREVFSRMGFDDR